MDTSIAEALIDALRARRGIVAVVGAGGKKTTLLRLIEAHRKIGTGRLALAPTVKMARATDLAGFQTILGDAETILARVRADQNDEAAFRLAATSSGSDRLAGLAPEVISRLHAEGRFDITLVKADGARMRMIKAPRDDEPHLPEGTATVLPVVSARVFGRRLSDKVAHRLERLAPVIQAEIGVALEPVHIARLLSSGKGALHRIDDNAEVVPIITMVDGEERLTLAREAARLALAMTERYDRVVLASMQAGSPLVEIVSRP